MSFIYKSPLLAFQILTAVAAVVFALLALLSAWFTRITYRAYKWQHREEFQLVNQYCYEKEVI